jgi:hypothetical protein
MLEPQDRVMLTEMLRPPIGHDLDAAIGTTFTLDLMALLVTPLSFALFDADSSMTDANGDQGPAGRTDPIALLESLRRYADRMTIFCQAGRTSIPPKEQPLFTALENSVVDACAPLKGLLFHPKIWVLRFVPREGSGPVRYRLVNLSRNLTFDRSWDTSLLLDGILPNRKRVIPHNRPLSEFLAALPEMAVHRPLAPETLDRIVRASREILRVEWELPLGAEEIRFLSRGLPGNRAPWPDMGKRTLIVSPFLGSGALEEISEPGSGDVLISRLEALQALSKETLGCFEQIYYLNDAAHLTDESDDPAPDMQGLHAKVYVTEDGAQTWIWTGSSNATQAGMNGNVEFLAGLRGKRSAWGIDTILRKTPGEHALTDLLVPFEPDDSEPIEDPDAELRVAGDALRRALAEAGLSIKVEASSEGRFALQLQGNLPNDAVVASATLLCWPIRLGETRSLGMEKALKGKAFDVEMVEISSFIAVDARFKRDGRSRAERFVLNLPIEGMPAERDDAILRDILRDKARVLRLLLFLLSGDDPRELARLLTSDTDGRDKHSDVPGFVGFPLFENLLRSLHREPRRLEHVARLVNDLSRTPEGEALIPEGFMTIWQPVWEAREDLAT